MQQGARVARQGRWMDVMRGRRPLLAAALVVLGLLSAACENGGSPTSPSGTLNVAGTYTGTVTQTLTDLGISSTAAARLVVTQTGSQVTINGTLTVAGETLDVQQVSGRLNADGTLTVTSEIDDIYAEECGWKRTTSVRFTFSGNTLDAYESFTTDYCGPGRTEGTLRR